MLKRKNKLSFRDRLHLARQRRRNLSFIYFSLGLSLGISLLIGLLSYGAYGPQENFLRNLFKIDEIKELSDKLTLAKQKNNELKLKLERHEELIKLDKGTRSKMSLLINNLESENARLKEDLAFFEDFVPGSLSSGIALKRFQVRKDSVPNQFNYRALVLQQAKKPSVTLTTQVLVKISVDGKQSTLIFPKQNDSESVHQIDLKRFARVSSTFSIPENAELEQVELRLYESDVIRAQATLEL